ncbi:MAG: hypothetical protein LBV59_05885 [Sphingobacterium sp.]|jgi:hypothetical protein|uniref:hypothetical protein n=1 Tax=Sphingobacterium sp. TaxID=341027 RepID=UPI00284BA67A|nr:hypothetical protein [Sphingobacterium sp.]MDR3007444.1 hypothetical protein [Sphingobacterium sp.]
MGNTIGNGKFEIEADGVKIIVPEHTVQDQQIYRLIFHDKRSPLVITRASTWGGDLWTSVPQGRQEEAEKFGKLVSEYLNRQ